MVEGERELYYKRLEEYLSLKLDGKLGPAELAKLQAEAARMREAAEDGLARALEARNALEGERARLEGEAQRGLTERLRELERRFEAKSEALEREHVGRLAEARELEARVEAERRLLAERQARLDEHYASQTRELETRLRGFRAEVDAQASFRAELAEGALTRRHEAFEAAWSREKTLLVSELEHWKGEAAQLKPRLFALERELAQARDEALNARRLADQRALELERLRHGR